MFEPITTEAALPPVGTAEGATLDFKAKLDPKWTGFWLARQVASFANSVGGTLLIGAAEDGRDALKQYVPLVDAEAKKVEQDYGDAIRQRCSPQPFFQPSRVSKDGGFVVAINVWPFPGQAIGVRIRADKGLDGSEVDAYVFPLRSGRTTTEILPEQLPMLMLPELRRVATLLSAVDETERVELLSDDPDATLVPVNLKAVEVLANVAVFTMKPSAHAITEIRVPLDRIETAWKDHGCWRVIIRGRVCSGDRGIGFYLR